MSNTKQHVVTAMVQNEPGTINRVVSLFRRRGFSLASFNAGDCEDPGFSRLTFLVNGDTAVVVQVLKQLDKLIDVVECTSLERENSVQRELCLIKMTPKLEDRERLYNLVLEFFARTPNANENSVVVEFAGTVSEVEKLIQALQPFQIQEIVRTGLVAIEID